MKAKQILTFLALSFTLLGCKKSIIEEGKPLKPNKDIRVVAYLPEYQMNRWYPGRVEQITDLAYFSIEPRTNGQLSYSLNNLSDLSRLRNDIDTADVNLLISLGGWGRSGNFAAMAADTNSRKVFVEQLTDFCLDNQLDGADLDWEFPETDEEVTDHGFLLEELKAAFEPHDLILTSAQAPGRVLSPRAIESLDRIHVMSYDAGGQHSTLEDAKSNMAFFLNQGASRKQIVLGLPCYARNVEDFSDVFLYRHLVNFYQPDSSTNQINNYYFNGIEMVEEKTQFTIDKGYGGIMLWEIGQDTQDETSLTLAIHNKKLSNQ